MCVSRRAWCIERCPPRSREASGSNPSPPTKTNLQILSHGDRRRRIMYQTTDGHPWTRMRNRRASRRAAHPRPSAFICVLYSSFRAGRPANAGERETLRREIRRSRRMQSGCAQARRSLANPPAGRGPKPQGQSGAKPVRFAQRTLASGAGRWQHRSAGDSEPSPGIRCKRRNVNSSTMNGASSPCQSATVRDGAASGTDFLRGG